MNIGEKIRKMRILKGFKQAHIADELDLSVTAYGNIERNTAELTFSRLEQIATVLEVSVLQIICVNEKMNTQSVTIANILEHRSVTDEVQGYKLAIDEGRKEIEYLRQQNTQLLESLTGS